MTLALEFSLFVMLFVNAKMAGADERIYYGAQFCLVVERIYSV